MELTQELLDQYVGGQFQISSFRHQYLYRGEIKSIRINGRTFLYVELAWSAMREQYPLKSSTWVAATLQAVGLCLSNYSMRTPSVSASSGAIGTIRMDRKRVSEAIALYLPSGEILDPTTVRGLAINREAGK